MFRPEGGRLPSSSSNLQIVNEACVSLSTHALCLWRLVLHCKENRFPKISMISRRNVRFVYGVAFPPK